MSAWIAVSSINIISFSGGKDSTALILWAKENLPEFQAVFCDTGWEHDLTYQYIRYINDTVLDGKLITLRSEKYKGFEDLCVKKQRVPSSQARYCTTELKLVPMKKHIKSLNEIAILYLGIRADESISRSSMPKSQYSNYYDCEVVRPLLRWTADECFAIMKRYGVEPNPLYKMGFSRVGCAPCIMARHSEVRIIIQRFPGAIDSIRSIEEKTKRTFFPVNYIPQQYCTKRDKKTGVMCPTIDDVVKYLSGGENQVELFKESYCMSIYGICE